MLNNFQVTLNNGNRTEWSPIQSEIIQVINKIRRPRSWSPISLITSMITDWIGSHEVLLPNYQNYNKICDISGLGIYVLVVVLCTCPIYHTRDAYCPITLSY